MLETRTIHLAFIKIGLACVVVNQSMLNGTAIIEELKKGRDILPVYCIYGDSYLMEETVNAIKARMLSSAFKDMNYHSFDAKEADADDIISIAQTFPVMSQKRLVIVNRIEALSKSQQEALLSYVQDPAKHTCLILIASAGKIDKRLSFFSGLDKAHYLFHFKPPSDAELPSWIKQEAQRLGKRITHDAIGIFLEATGSELMDIKQEIAKLVLFVGEREGIERKDVETSVANGRVDTVFDLADSIGRKNLREGMINLNKLIEQGEEPVKILGMIARQFRMIWRVKAMKKNGAAVNSIASALGTFPTYIHGYLKQGKDFSNEGLRTVFQLLHHADIALKSGRQSPHMVMERLVMELCLK
ncbi:MAG: DNA polymerase III subunit delta [Deltaproteobacteria bacterium]|nr:DNA polymerase III subunit delta [Deltaproteobacteria bacterium]